MADVWPNNSRAVDLNGKTLHRGDLVLILPKADPKGFRMLSVISAAVAVGIAVAAIIRLRLGLDLQVPLTLAKVLVPLLAVPWVWHWRKWPAVDWVEAIAYVVMVAVAQLVMEVNVLSAFLVIPVLGVIHRDRWLTLVSAALGTAATGVLLMRSAVIILDTGRPALQFGAQLVLQWALAFIYTGLIGLAEKAERYLRHARMTEQMATQWAASIEARDRYTGGHVERVTRYAMKLAPHISELDMDLESFQLACVLHDVGKIAVPDAILNKPGPLTPEEHEIMKAHATKGYEVVLRTDLPMEVAAVVRYHHERWDGQGYPDGLRAEEIPMASRILAVADAFDAMTTDRPYRAGLSPTEARARIQAGSGSQFDPTVVEAFMRQFADGWVEPDAPSPAIGWGVPGEAP
jgi:putative nucleotidyltransferase with HDIG domain